MSLIRPLAALLGGVVVTLGGLSAVAATAPVLVPRSPAAHKPGSWTPLATNDLPSSTPAMWMSASGRAWDVFTRTVPPSHQTYDVAELAPTGAVAPGPKDIFAGHDWGEVLFSPTLLPHGSEPIVVFAGTGPGQYIHGCVYGAVPGATDWTAEPWTLSYDCYNPLPAAGESRGGVLAAAWPGSWTTGSGVNYRIGVVPIPAPAQDRHIEIRGPLPGFTGVANDSAGNGHFYVFWLWEGNKPGSRDGYYAEDVTAGSAALKAPDSGTNSVGNFYLGSRIATANSNTHGGVFLLYCDNGSTCQLRLWRVGAKSALAVPSSATAFGEAIAPGPDGRLWVAWYSHSTNNVLVTRTNKADTRFGPVEVYRTPCFEDGLLALGGAQFPRLDIALQCINNAHLAEQEYVTQVLAGLFVSPGVTLVTNTAARTVVFTVTDAGDPVKGATVRADGKTATTNAAGKATIHLARGLKPGTYAVTATAANYQPASGKLRVRG